MPLSFSHKPSLVAYLTCGDPDLVTTRDIALAAIEAGADVIELGVPFSDPVADGPVIQRASERALRRGTSLLQVLKLAKEIRQRSQVGLIIFTYLNPVLRMGMARFGAAAQDACVDGALITDLPVEESHEYLSEMQERALATVFLAAPTSTQRRLELVAKYSTGFVYLVSRTGVTGEQASVSTAVTPLVSAMRKVTGLPLAVGFGISTADQVRTVGALADGVVVGTAVVRVVEQNVGSADLPAKLEALARELASGLPSKNP